MQANLLTQLKSYLPVDQRRLRLISGLLVTLIKLQDACLSDWMGRAAESEGFASSWAGSFTEGSPTWLIS